MATIQDVSPTRSNTTLGSGWPYTTGRMLSVASSDDGRFVVAGAFSSSVWLSEDGGETFAQAQWPQPPAGQFGVPGAIGGCCVTSLAIGPDAARWRPDRNPRALANVTDDRRADIVGFGDTGVWTARGNGDGTFAPPRIVLADFGVEAGGWQVDRHPRLLGALTASRRADIVGFGDDGVWTALARTDGTFADPKFVLNDFGYVAGGWRVDRHLRALADLRGNGRMDIVGFGDAGVYVALSNGDGTFTYRPQPVLADFGTDHGWQVGPPSALRRRHHRQRPRGHRRLRQCRRLRRARQRRRHVPAAALRAVGPGLRQGMARRASIRASSRTCAIASAWTSSRSAMRACTSRSATATARSRSSRRPSSATSASRRAAGASTAIRASSPTSAATVAPTSSASATPASTWRAATGTGRSPTGPSR